MQVDFFGWLGHTLGLIIHYIVEFFTGIPAASFSMLGPGGLAPWSIVIVDTWMWTPFVMLICLAGLRSIPDSIYEAAECDRASKWRQFWTITFPYIRGLLMLALLFRHLNTPRATTGTWCS